MRVIDQLWPPGSVAAGLATLSLAVVFGLALGAIRFRGFKLGIAGVLFSSLLLGQFGLSINVNVSEFLRDFSLILFVYSIGLQVGPGFVDSLKAEGLRLNLLAIAVLLVGGVITALVVKAMHLDAAKSPGLYAGAFTTTAGLAAGQETLARLVQPPGMAVAAAGLAYAVTYPLGLIGPSLSIAIMRSLFRINMCDELDALAAAKEARSPRIGNLDIDVTNPELAGMAIKDLKFAREHSILFTRLLHDKVLSVPTAETRVDVGDVIRAVGRAADLEMLARQMGHVSSVDLAKVSDRIARMDVVVTRTAVLRKPLRELDLINRVGIALARVTRAGIDLAPSGSLTLHFGDVVTAVGPPSGLKAVETELGNSQDALDRPQLIPIFVGIVLGVLVGSIPIAIPGVHAGLRLGLASGPMLVAIVLSRLGNIGSVVWYMPAAANSLLRDFGLAVFLACVGLAQGANFVGKLLSGDGLVLVAWGAAITILPLLLVGMAARWIFKMNFVTLSGWAAGAMTSSPALVFAGEVTGSAAPALAYAAVAPLAFIVPIICCQVLAAIG